MRKLTRKPKRRNVEDPNAKIPVHIALKKVSLCIKFTYLCLCGCQAGDREFRNRERISTPAGRMCFSNFEYGHTLLWILKGASVRHIDFYIKH